MLFNYLLNYLEYFLVDKYMAIKQQFIIPKITHEFEVVSGTVLSDSLGLFAYNTGSTWTMWAISDIKSGLQLVCKLKTLTDCKAWVDNISQEMLDKIDEARHTDKYNNMCNIIKQKALELDINNKYYESLSFDEAFLELNDINSEDTSQVCLFNLNEWFSGYTKLCEAVHVDFANEVAKLIDKYPERFSGIDAENLAKPKHISIDYLDGCTDITFDTGLGEDDPIADLTGNSTNILALDEYDDLMKEVFKGKVDK